MLLSLHSLPDDYFHVRDQILGSPIVPNFTSTCSTLLCVPGKHTTDITPHVDDSSALVSQHDGRTRPHNQLLFILAQIQFFMKGPNILRTSTIIMLRD